MALLVQFSCLQLLDLLSTLAFLDYGVQEANPLVRAMIQACGSAVSGLAVVKALALLLGVYCWRSGRLHLLARANVFFAALVGWNLVALLVAAGAR